MKKIIIQTKKSLLHLLDRERYQVQARALGGRQAHHPHQRLQRPQQNAQEHNCHRL